MASFNIIMCTIVLLVTFETAVSQFSENCEEDTCMETFEKCGGRDFNVSAPCCGESENCVVKNFYYAQCLTEERAARNVANGWDGTVLDCEEMPTDVLMGPEHMAPTRRLLETEGSETMNCEDDTCVEMFGKCGGGYNVSSPCCDEDASCVVKNWYYAQCLTEERAAMNVVNGWDGRIIMCEEVPEDAPKGPAFSNPVMETNTLLPNRKLHQVNCAEASILLNMCWCTLRKGLLFHFISQSAVDCEDDDCGALFEKCGGKDYNVSIPCCDEGAQCVIKNYFYAQCLTEERAMQNVMERGWDGRIMECDEMPEDLEPKKPDMNGRRLTATGHYGGYGDGHYGSYGGYGMDGMYGTYGVYGMHGSYGMYGMHGTYGTYGSELEKMMSMTDPTATAQAPTQSPAMMGEQVDSSVQESATVPITPSTEVKISPLVMGKGCKNCAPIFGQCGDKGAVVSCCGQDLVCTKKNEYFAQCLTRNRARRNMRQFGWIGTELKCGEKML